jgi:hypothetical protein
MEILKTAFEDYLTFEEAPDLGTVTVQGRPFSPFEVLSHDKDLFDQKFTEWRDGIWLSQQLRIRDAILTDAENADTYRLLRERIKAGGVIPFVGAGMSCASGFLTWRQLLLKLRQHVIPHLDESSLLATLSSDHGYELAAEQIINGMSPFSFQAKLEFYNRIPEGQAAIGAIRYLPIMWPSDSSRPQNALTTNFDELLEFVYSSHSKPFARVLQGKQILDLTDALMDGTAILKLHGDYRNPDNRVLTNTEYDNAYAPRCAHRTEMEKLLTSRCLLFLGCSLSQDRTMTLAKEAFEAIASLPEGVDNRDRQRWARDLRHFAFLAKPETEATRREREAFLSDRHILPIWYGDYGASQEQDFPHDEKIEALIVSLINDLGRIGDLTVKPDDPDTR